MVKSCELGRNNSDGYGVPSLSPVDRDGPVTETLPHYITPIFFVKILMCS